ncbi:hypothetical protein [Pleionea mediterranea]|uniref:Uncharacterized protein n=1 Tax=Pleionea mediterranea TaxID=523701 RepID=A0A316FT73_9GAMM|nr:hypothetical protein [Pleionea mediterranea]PWK51904.1 hypothetical protein C8D97_105220 [Pleionea mediterranea]
MNRKVLLAALFSVASSTALLAKEPTPIPEMQGANKATSGSATMKCLVDTPAWDNWGYGRCFSVGHARSTTAYFQIEGGPSNFRVYWSDSRCSQNSKSCSLPIYQYQSINLTADVLDLSNNSFSSVSATAHYEGYH